MPDIPVDLPIEKRIAASVETLGEPQFVLRAVSLIAGHNEGEEFLLVVGGEHAKGILEGAPVLYWPELWGMRALLYAWDDSAAPAVAAGLENQAWRVREMAARVAALRGLPVRETLLGLLTDDVAPRARGRGARPRHDRRAGGHRDRQRAAARRRDRRAACRAARHGCHPRSRGPGALTTANATSRPAGSARALVRGQSPSFWSKSLGLRASASASASLTGPAAASFFALRDDCQ